MATSKHKMHGNRSAIQLVARLYLRVVVPEHSPEELDEASDVGEEEREVITVVVDLAPDVVGAVGTLVSRGESLVWS